MPPAARFSRLLRSAAGPPSMARGASFGPATSSASVMGFGSRAAGPGPRGNERAQTGAFDELDAIARQESARCHPHYRGHDRRGPLSRMGRIPGRAGAVSTSRRTRAHAAGQPRPQCRRSRQSGTPGSADKPQQTASRSCGPCPPWRPYKAAAYGWWITRRAAWAPTLTDVLEPHRAQIAEFADAGRLLLSLMLGRPVGQGLPVGGAAGAGGRARHHAVELERGNALLLHQCTRPDLGRAGRKASRSPWRNTRERAGSSRSITIPSNIPARRKRFPNASARR